MNKKRVIGIIAEYNPLHNGHKYQLSYAKEQLQADGCIVVMSGNFVQRGTPAIIEKYSRARMAVSEGADLVFELPVYYSSGSLDAFSWGAVTLLDSLGTVSNILFGSESGSIRVLAELSRAMLSDADSFQIIRSSMKTGLTYDMAKKTALSAILDEDLFRACMDAVSQPNNMLGILYLNTLTRLDSVIVPLTQLRVGRAYHDINGISAARETPFVSASAIRKHLLSIPWGTADDLIVQLSPYIPSESLKILKDALCRKAPLSANDCWKHLRERLSAADRKLSDFDLVSEDLAEKIDKTWQKCNSWDELVSRLASANTSGARINRSLTHIMLDITKDDMRICMDSQGCRYGRVLAMSETGEVLLEDIRRISKLPILYTDSMNEYPPNTRTLLRIDQTADRIYDSLCLGKRY